jgi:Gpi18-like mannosyltransferase
LNGAVWGQCDIVFTTFLLLCICATIAGMGALATLLFGFALAFKLQAVFLIPFIIAMLLQRRIRWWHLLLVPVGWLVALLPPLLNGAQPWEFFMLPSTQGDAFPTLAINIGNPWMIAEWLHVSVHLGTLGGMALTILVVVALSLWGARSGFKTATNTLVLAALCTLVMPYIMPKMHDRYFFTAEVLLCILSCVDRAFVLPAALVLSASLLSYVSYFQQHERLSMLAVSLAANTAALWLAFRWAAVRAADEESLQPHVALEGDAARAVL